MDYISPNFPFVDQSIDDNLLQFSSNVPCQQFIIQPDDQLLFSSFENGSHDLITNKFDNSWRKESASSGGSHGNPIDKKKKKLVHRDIERQRRQEMAILHVSLKSLLPFEYLKGKRAISDHMDGAVNYIRHLQNKIKELNDKRDELKRLPESPVTRDAVSEPECSENCPQDSVTIKPCSGGVEVLINTGLRQGFPLSKVLGILTAEGLNIVSCISAKVNERLLYTIKSEENDGISVDLSSIQLKIVKLTCWPSTENLIN